MPLRENIKKLTERVTGIGRPKPGDIQLRNRKANTYRFSDDGETPNNPHFAMILYRSPVVLDEALDPAAIFEELFASNGWVDSWRDGIYDFNHFHTGTHEVLGIARGHTRVRFGGARGRIVTVKAGDVVVQPAGNGHRRIAASKNLLVVGAYPKGSDYDEPTPDDVDIEKARRSIAKVKAPPRDPVYGANGPLKRLWKRK
jgi:uncharacterized protein YjlB